MNSDDMIKEDPPSGGKNPLINWLRRLIQGVFIGSGAILPGVSGGVLCVTFGFYQPMMALLAHPIKAFTRYYRLFIPVIIGWLFGFFIFAKLTNMFFSASSSLAASFFIGLIAGSIPTLFKEANKNGKRKNRWLFFIFSFIFMFGFFLFFELTPTTAINPNIWWFLLCGALWGLSLIVPGMTSSSVLIYLGLYEPLTAGISTVDIGVLGPMVIGIIIVVLLLSKAANSFFSKFYSAAYHVVLGFVLASTLIIIPLDYAGIGEALICLLLFIVGFAVAWLLDRFGKADKN